MKRSISLFFLLFLCQAVTAQDAFQRFQFDPDISYDPTITSPQDYLGYELGAEYTFHHQVMDYLRLLADESDKITVQEYARSYEERDLNYAVISSEVNQESIESIRKRNLELADQPQSGIQEDQKIIVWMSYNVHGNEPSSSEAAMQTAYYLVAAQSDEAAEWRDNAVVIIDPMINPDGRDRYVYWYKSSQANILNTNAEDLEHDEIWPGGRTNHYWFDLNRDWVWLVHPESRGRIAAYQQWMPQVHIDFHEQGFNNNYFTMPGTTPRNHELPDDYENWADIFGRGAIEKFDAAKVNYETRERFDFFYPGYGSSYPSIMGGIGMLAEQGGHSRGGRAVETNDGYILTLRQRVYDHYKNGLSIVNTSVENREALLQYFADARSQSTQKGNTKVYILPDDPNDYTYDVINMLLSHGVEVERATEDFNVRDAYSYWDGSASGRSFKSGDFIIKTDQPAHLFINTLMRRQLEIRDSVMYDMATWSVPLAYNLDAAWTQRSVGVSTELLTENLLNPSGLMNQGAEYAYVVDWNQRNAPKALSKLWDMGYKVRSAENTFTKDGRTYSRGSLVILLGRNYERIPQIHEDMEMLAKEAGVQIQGFDSGRMDEGSDLGATSMNPVEKPRVALMIDSPFSSYTAGQLWFLFDQWTEFGIDRIRSDNAGGLDLTEYDVILMPGAGGIDRVINDALKASLMEWVSNGGVLIGTESSGSWMTSDESGITDIAMASDGDVEEQSDEIDPAAYTRYEDREDSTGLRRIPGSAFRAHLDTSHPLAFGLKDRIYSLKFGTDELVPAESYHSVGYYTQEEVLASGYASQENQDNAAGMTFAAVKDMGSGKVVLLLDNTQYRMFWVGPARMIQNAVMLLHGF
ncbi:M14 family zinc carboxypeptidase [Balneola sp. MJW-20]|uniref:M14 family zinc carboxypeptidase n=1 Tax=Gracilimonas aurantiaca TaxID=3234185 RepID=UPI00346651D3